MLKQYNITAERLLIILILIIAAFLRFWNFGSLPFMHDEFSAIFRAYYDSLSELIELGVKQNDTHPAGVQIFIYYWIKIFGLSEPVLKLPFTLLGLGSVFLTWLVAKRWFNSESALFSAAIMAITQYNIFYSQLARPYAPGLFFSLLSVWFWTKIVFDSHVKKSTVIWFVLIVAVNSYIHAFTLFFNLIMMLTGLFFVRGKRLRLYILSGVAIFVLYLPGISVFYAQLSRGGIGNWLHEPHPDFIVNYLSYVFHFSRWFFLTTLAILLFLTVKYYNRNQSLNKFRVIGIGWFVVTFLVAFLYSLFRSPIIQYSTLLFVFPFLLTTITSFIGKLPLGTKILALVLIMTTSIFTLVYERKHYAEMYEQGFDQIPANVISDLKGYSNSKTAVILQAPDTRMFDYYFNKYGENPDYFKLENSTSVLEVLNYLNDRDVDVVLFGWADYAPLSYLETIKRDYPFIIKKKSWFNSEYWIISKKELEGVCHVKDKVRLVKRIGSFKVDSETCYSQSIKLSVDTLELNEYDVLNVQMSVDLDSMSYALLVFDWRDDLGKKVYWSAAKFSDYLTVGGSNVATISLRVTSLPAIPEKGVIKFYIWKRDHSEFVVNQISVYITHIDPVELGLFEKF